MFEISRFDNISVVGVHGELVRDNVHALEDLLNSFSSHDHINVVLDLDKLKHLDYRLVKLIADRIVEFKCSGGDIKMAAASGYIRAILQAMGLEEEVYVSVEDALLSFVGDIPEEERQ